jgi:hypothetical protein
VLLSRSCTSMRRGGQRAPLILWSRRSLISISLEPPSPPAAPIDPGEFILGWNFGKTRASELRICSFDEQFCMIIWMYGFVHAWSSLLVLPKTNLFEFGVSITCSVLRLRIDLSLRVRIWACKIHVQWSILCFAGCILRCLARGALTREARKLSIPNLQHVTTPLPVLLS